MRVLLPVGFVVAVLVLGNATYAQAQVATFNRIRDAVPEKFFDADTSDPGNRNPNALVIGLDSGFDAKTLTYNNFAVSTLAYANRTASDTISFRVVAPEGYYVAKLVYKQKGVGSTLRGAVQRGVAQWTVAGFPSLIGEFGADPNLNATVNLNDLQRTTVPVSLTVSLFAGPTGSLEITDARVVVTLAPLPTPPQ